MPGLPNRAFCTFRTFRTCCTFCTFARASICSIRHQASRERFRSSTLYVLFIAQELARANVQNVQHVRHVQNVHFCILPNVCRS